MQQTTGALRTQWIHIPVLDGDMEAYMVKPTSHGPWPAVIVLMEIFGINSHIQEVTERIAAAGYVAIAPNYYHRTTKNMNLDYSDNSTMIGRQHKDQTTRSGLLSDLRAVIQTLQDESDVLPKNKMGCIGFCFGGHVAFIAAGMREIAATAAFYPGGVAVVSPGGGEPTVKHSSEIQGEILCLFGEQDPLIPHEQTVIVEQALKDASVQHEVVRYSHAGHGFFCNQREDYDASSADDAWHRVSSLFDRVLRK